MNRAQAPIADAKDRDALSGIVARIRPDWDRHGINAALAKNPCQELDVLAAQALIAATTRPDQRTPAILGLDGDHTNRARVALGAAAVTPGPLTGAEKGAECGTCGIRRGYHHGIRASLDHGPHDWQPAAQVTPASPDAIRAARPPRFHKGDPE